MNDENTSQIPFQCTKRLPRYWGSLWFGFIMPASAKAQFSLCFLGRMTAMAAPEITSRAIHRPKLAESPVPGLRRQ